MTKIFSITVTKMFVHFHKYRTVFRGLCLVIFILVCILLRYYLWALPRNSNFDLSKPVRISDLDVVCASMRQQYQTAGQTASQQHTEVPSAQKRTVPRQVPSLAHRIVHLDLKGAPPTVSYYASLFEFLRQQNVTGLLIEYEDMFPYWGPVLQHVPALNAYSKKDIQTIVQEAKKNNLEIIPLIQTFGHLEYVLKHKSKVEMREVPSFPNVICPTHQSTMEIIQTMINQTVELHPGITYLHIGCDEVYELGKCSRCQSLLTKKEWLPAQLFLHHVTRVAQYVRQTFPKITPLIWEDHLRTMSVEQIVNSNLTSFVEPVVWNYHPNVADYITHETWTVYSQVFKHIWIASAFKGATTPDSVLPNIKNHIDNHIAWSRIIDIYSPFLNFRGIIITGWQRYDHFAVLCELLPVGIPSLVAALRYIQTYSTNGTQKINDLMESLKCEGSYPLQVQDIPYEGIHCIFPGSAVLKVVSQFSMISEQVNALKTPTLRGWLSSFNVKYNASNPYLVLSSTEDLNQVKGDLDYIERAFREAASPYFDQYTIDEWLATHVKPLVKWVDELVESKDKLLANTDWPQRPFNRKTEL